MDLKCDEKVDKAKIDFDVNEIELEILHEERCKRYAAEAKIYFIIKEFINTLNKNAISPEFMLKVIATGYRCTKKHFELVVYSADRWEKYFIDGLAKCIEENWMEELNAQKRREYVYVEAIKDMLYVTTYRVESDHLIHQKLNIFYHNY